MTAKSFGRIAAEHATVRIAYMSEITRGRIRAVGAGLCVCATLASGGSSFLAANDAPIRLLGVRAQGSAIVIEASAPVAFAVSNPDAWTVQLDLRDVSVDGAANQVTRTDTVARVSLEQASAVDGREVARVRLSLARPASYKVRSARSTIRVELADAPAAMPVAAVKPSAAPEPVLPAPEPVPVAPSPSPEPNAPSPSPEPMAPVPGINVSATPIPTGTATVLDRVKTARNGGGIAVTLGGDGYLAPASVTESRDLPRRLVLDFPGVTPKAAAQTAVSGGLVRTVRIAANSRQPLVTRVVMELAPGVTYHVERAGEGGRDLAVLFEPPLVMVAPSDDAPTAVVQPEPPMTMEQALANAASLKPTDTPANPMSALQIDSVKAAPTVQSVSSTSAGPARGSAHSPVSAAAAVIPTPAPVAVAAPSAVSASPMPAQRRSGRRGSSRRRCPSGRLRPTHRLRLLPKRERANRQRFELRHRQPRRRRLNQSRGRRARREPRRVRRRRQRARPRLRLDSSRLRIRRPPRSRSSARRTRSTPGTRSAWISRVSTCARCCARSPRSAA